MKFSKIFKRVLVFSKKNWPEIILFTILFLFSLWLMWHTFGYKDHTFYIAAKVWSDFAANLPLIRSFSFGFNFPPEYPLFPGEPIKYHFLFYLLVGLLERIGLRLDWALNIPSALSFFGLMVMIYLFAKLLFKSNFVAILSVIMFLFNGTLSFLEFFKTHLLSLDIFNDIYHLANYPSFMPYGSGEVTAFWSLNTFINQRHLALAFGLVFLCLYLLLKSDRDNRPINLPTIIFIGFILGLFPSLHKAVFIMTALVFAIVFLLFPKLRVTLLKIFIIILAIALPQLYLTNQLINGSSSISFYPGYLVYNRGLEAFIRHWIMNFGLNIFLIPLGFIFAPTKAKKVLIAFLSLFIIGNLFRFSPEIAANHKFFNLFLIVGNMFSAWVVYLIWRKKKLGKIIAPILIFFLIFSGIIDFFPIKNDTIYIINDAPKNPDITWIKKNTPPDAVFLNSSFLYHPASLAGRKIFFGWPYFSWSAGYDTNKRDVIREKILGATTVDKTIVCDNLRINGIRFVSLGKDDSRGSSPNFLFWKNNFTEVYNNSSTGFLIYDVNKSCL